MLGLRCSFFFIKPFYLNIDKFFCALFIFLSRLFMVAMDPFYKSCVETDLTSLHIHQVTCCFLNRGSVTPNNL
jgi:hypothetical protein